MKQDVLTIHIIGKGDGTISPSSLATVIRGVSVILNQVDASVAAERQPTLQWHIDFFSMNSPLLTRWHPTTEGDVDYGKQVLTFALQGIDQIAARADAIPPHFSGKAITAMQHIAAEVGRDLNAVDLESPYTRRVSFGATMSRNLQVIKSKSIPGRESRSSFRGYLKSISIRNNQVFHIEDQMYGYITCTFGDELLDTLKSGLFSERVLVSGNTRFTADNRPISIQVDQIERLPSRSELPQFSDLEKLKLKKGHGVLGNILGTLNAR